MGSDPFTGFLGLALGKSGTEFADDVLGLETPAPPGIPDAPPPVTEVDIASQVDYTRRKAKERKGRASTILGSQSLGLSGGKKTVLG